MQKSGKQEKGLCLQEHSSKAQGLLFFDLLFLYFSPFIFRKSSFVIEAVLRQEFIITFCCFDYSLSSCSRTYFDQRSTNFILSFLFCSRKFIIFTQTSHQLPLSILSLGRLLMELRIALSCLQKYLLMLCPQQSCTLSLLFRQN